MRNPITLAIIGVLFVLVLVVGNMPIPFLQLPGAESKSGDPTGK